MRLEIFFEPESKMIDVYGEIIVPQFGEYNYIHQLDSKPEFILFWNRDSSTIFKKEMILLINYKKLKMIEISRMNLIVGGEHG